MNRLKLSDGTTKGKGICHPQRETLNLTGAGIHYLPSTKLIYRTLSIFLWLIFQHFFQHIFPPLLLIFSLMGETGMPYTKLSCFAVLNGVSDHRYALLHMTHQPLLLLSPKIWPLRCASITCVSYTCSNSVHWLDERQIRKLLYWKHIYLHDYVDWTCLGRLHRNCYAGKLEEIKCLFLGQ